MINLKVKANLEMSLECDKDRAMIADNAGTIKLTFDELISSDEVLGSAGVFISDIEYHSPGVLEYEANIFDFVKEMSYEELEVNANRLISEVLLQYPNVRGYSLGKYIHGNSFGIKIIFMIFRV